MTILQYFHFFFYFAFSYLRKRQYQFCISLIVLYLYSVLKLGKSIFAQDLFLMVLKIHLTILFKFEMDTLYKIQIKL